MAKRPIWKNEVGAKDVILATNLWNKVEAAALKQADLEYRSHCGASGIGDECARKVWYGFRWAGKELPEPRMVRLWDRGNREEFVFEKLLQDAGMERYTMDATTNTQFRISDFDGHYGGSLDGIGRGLPEMPEEWVLLEFKTHKDTSFRSLIKSGVRESKPQHAAQMDTYMAYRKLNYALYCAVNKDTDELYFEIVAVNIAAATRFKMRAEICIYGKIPPKRISKLSSYMYCKYCCEFAGTCHNNEAPDVNCRTCVHSEPGSNATWKCNKLKTTLNKQEQLAGCEQYKRNPNFHK